MITFTEMPPPAALRPVVASVWWYATPPAAAGEFRVLPDGSTDLLVRYEASAAGQAAGRPVVDVVGPTDRGRVVAVPPAAVFVGVRLRPEAGAAVLGVGPAELLYRQVPVADCAPRLSRALGRLDGPASTAGAVRAVVAMLGETLPAGRAAGVSGRVRRAVELLGAGPEGGRVWEAARAVGVSERTLQREVRAATGLAPKALARVLRFQRALAALGGPAPADLCSVALDCGYADQSHMTREFSALAGLPPAALLG